MKVEEYINQHEAELKELLVTLCGIPAPSKEEEKRAEFCRQWLQDAGAEEVTVDEALNVRCLIRGKTENDSAGEVKLPMVVFMAHTDTVFPDKEPMKLTERDGKIFCPGVGDDTANLAVLLMSTRYLLDQGLRPQNYDLLIVANSGEEGLGNLKGSRQIMKEFGDRIAWFYSLDGTAYGYVNKAVGSRRYRIEVRTEGGHSYGNFGNANAIAVLAGMIGSFYELKVPEKGRTTYNVGSISGGTSVNTIAQQAEMLYEYRSDHREDMAFMERHFRAVIESYLAKGYDVRVELLGERPCTGELDEGKMESLAAGVVQALSGAFPELWEERIQYGQTGGHSGSTDCNIPLSMGIPAICFGCYIGGSAHTREEWIEESSLKPGWQAALEVMMQYFK